MAKQKPQGKEVTLDHADKCVSRLKERGEFKLPANAAINFNGPAFIECYKNCNALGFNFCFGEDEKEQIVAVIYMTDESGNNLGAFEDATFCPPFC